MDDYTPDWEITSGPEETTSGQTPPPFAPPSYVPPIHSAPVHEEQQDVVRRRTGLKSAVAFGLVVALAAFSGAGFGRALWPGTPSSHPQSVTIPYAGGNTSSSIDGNMIASRVSSTLVDINTDLSYQGESAAGTGIVLSSDGLVLTNNHVISGATSISATNIGNGKTYSATVVGYDRKDDIAVIQLSGATGLKTTPLGNSSTAAVGQPIVGVGNAGGVGGAPSLAFGNIVALNQSVIAQDQGTGTSETLTGLIQTNAPIQPGDSGGPLVDKNGNTIGIDTAASTGVQVTPQGVTPQEGFSIPINKALSIAHAIIGGNASSTVHIGKTGFLGVQVIATPNNNGQAVAAKGVSVQSAFAGTPAATLGLAAGDVIVSVNGTDVNSPNELSDLLQALHPGDKVTIVWQDSSGATHTGTVALADGPSA